MKLKYILILLIIAALTAGTVFTLYITNTYRDKKVKTQNISTTPAEEVKTTPKIRSILITDTFFVPVAGLKSKVISISSNSLKEQNTIYTLEENVELIKKLNWFNEETVKPLSKDELIRKLNEDLSSIGVVNFLDLDIKLKILELDNKFIFDKKLETRDTYPLKLSEKKEVDGFIHVSYFSNFYPNHVTKIGHTGSVIPARGVQYHIEKSFKNDYTTLFKPTKPLFDTFDYTSATFEAPVLGKGRFCNSCMVLVGPDKFMEGVSYSGIDLFSLAANHIMDAGVEGIVNTQKKLDETGIKHLGASAVNNDEAGKPILVEVNGMKIAYLAFNDSPGYETWAKADKPGAASISDVEVSGGRTTKYEPNEERIQRFIQRAKDLKPDVIAAIMHWGSREYVAEKLPYQKLLADLLVKNGVDIILGDHTHWVQEIEFQGEKPVFYGVGNYVFDQMWSIETMQGMSIELNFYNKKLVNFRLHPHQLDLHKRGTIDLLKPEQKEYQQILDRVWNVSKIK